MFRLKTQQNERPRTYEDIQESAAMKSLPDEITIGENEMVRTVIAHIPVIPDEY